MNTNSPSLSNSRVPEVSQQSTSSNASMAEGPQQPIPTNCAVVPITSYIRKPPSKRRVELVDKQVVSMVAKGHHALRIVEEPEFRKLIEMVSNCPGYHLPTRKTLTNSLIPQTYCEVFENIQKNLIEAHAVCLATDGWTSITNQSYIAVTAHFINSDTKLTTVLLGCLNYNERHTSSNLMAFLRQMAQDWRITHKITCIVSDNAPNILAAIRLGDWRSMSCFAHSINLAVQHSLSEIGDIVGKVKAIVEFFKRSAAGLTKLQDMQKQMNLPVLNLKQECPTRWNSCYDMLDRIIKVKDAVISTLALIKSDLTMQPHEWQIIEQVVPILQPFYEITIEISAEKFVTLSKVLIFVQIMSLHIVRCSAVQNESEEIKRLLENLKKQIQERFHELEKNNLYAESSILDPRFKRKGFRTVESYNRACESLKRRICQVRLAQEEPEPESVPPPVEVPASVSIWDDFDREMSTITHPVNPVAAGIREFDKYLNEEYIDRKKDPLEWWRSRRHIYPHLYIYMLKRLCIQATSVSCERVFSNAGQVLNQRRTLLKPGKVSQLLFLHNNL